MVKGPSARRGCPPLGDFCVAHRLQCFCIAPSSRLEITSKLDIQMSRYFSNTTLATANCFFILAFSKRIYYSGCTTDTSFDVYRSGRAIPPTGPAFHAKVFIAHHSLFCFQCENPVRANFNAAPTAGTFFFIVFKCSDTGEVFKYHIICSSLMKDLLLKELTQLTKM